MRVLAVIAKNSEAPPTGYEICQTLGLGSGTVYPALEKLEELDEAIEGYWEKPAPEDRPPRRFYKCRLPICCIRHLEIYFPELLEKTPKQK